MPPQSLQGVLTTIWAKVEHAHEIYTCPREVERIAALAEAGISRATARQERKHKSVSGRMIDQEFGTCVLSWDDGAPDDLRVAEICSCYGLAATFFVPINNREGRGTMSGPQLRELAAQFEIGSHTKDHVYLDTCDVPSGQQQILDGRRGLEDLLGKSVNGFSYPGGRKPAGYADFLSANGFAYARTTENFCQAVPNDLYEMPVTLQLYPHLPLVLIKNALRGRSKVAKLNLAMKLCARQSVAERLSFLIDMTAAEGKILHIWGHSWELESVGGWTLLQDICKRIAGSGLKSITVRMAAEQITGHE